MQARMKNPMIIPEAMQALHALHKATENKGVPATTLGLVHLRVSQINGCSVCVDMGWRTLQQTGETNERMFAVSAWRDAPYFSEAERAALALGEAVTLLSGRTDSVPDHIWQEAVAHYDEHAIAALLSSIAMTNVFNRLNVATRQVPGEWMKSANGQAPSAIR